MTLTDDIYSKGTLISTSTYNDTLERLNYDKERLSEYFNAVQGTRYHETFQVTGTYQKVFNLVSGTYKVGSNSIEVYVNKKQITNFEETSENKVTLSDQVNAGSTVDIYYKNEPKYDPSEIDKMLNDYSSFIEQAKELTSTIQSIQDIWTNDITSKTASLIQDTLDKAVNSFNSKLDALSNDITTNNKTLTTNVQAAQSRINDLDTLYSDTSNTLKASFNSLQSIANDIHDKVTNLVDPFDKSKDTIGGRNLLLGTSGTLQTVTNASGWNTSLPVITPVVTKIDSDTTYTARAWLSPVSYNMSVQIAWKDAQGTQRYNIGNTISAGTSGYSTWTKTLTAGSTIRYVTITFNQSQSTPSSVSYKEMMLEKGNVATGWTPAPEDKVNVSDTTNWQKYPITDVMGAPTVHIGVNYPYKSIKQLLDTSSTGFYTTYIGKDATDTPDSSDNWRGIIQLQFNRVWGILTGEFTKVSYYVGGIYNGNTSSLSWIKLANDPEVVHTIDMRKPASDVAGIEEVNAKQDKIGYTPADDSKVVHDNHDGTITANNVTYDLSTSGLTSISYYSSGSFNDLPLGTVLAKGNSLTNSPDSSHYFTTTTFYSNQNNGGKAQIAIASNVNLMYFRVGSYNGGSVSWNSWTLLSDDSKVAHLSGANNFTGSIQHNGNPVGARIQASNNDEDSAINDSAKGNSDDIYYWTQD